MQNNEQYHGLQWADWNSVGAASTCVTIRYTSVQTPGNKNLVLVRWRDREDKEPESQPSVIDSVTDSNGNTYMAAGKQNMEDGVKEESFLADNILPGFNQVTVTFSEPVYSQIAIGEVDENNNGHRYSH